MKKTEKKIKDVKIPKKKPLKKDEVIKMLKEELIRKDKEIEKLRKENQVLMNLTYKNTKRQLEKD